MHKIALCWLTVTPSKDLIDFAEKCSEHYDIYICVDSNESTYTSASDKIHFIQYDESTVAAAGFNNTVSFMYRPCSRDKALYHFCRVNTAYDHVWLIEDDVFIPCIDVLQKMDRDYSTSDLLCTKLHTYADADAMEWTHWRRMPTHIEYPWIRSMICAMRISKRGLGIVADYAATHKTLFFCELIFTTLLYHNNCIINTPLELSNVIWRHTWNMSNLTSDQLYHPIKDVSLHTKYRAALNEKKTAARALLV